MASVVSTPIFRQGLIPLALLIGVCLFASGCGTEVLEARLETGRKYFEHEAILNKHLQPAAWNHTQFGMSMRIPLGFSLSPEPTPAKFNEKDELIEEAGPDERQPNFLGEDFPGIVAQWKKRVPTDTGEDEAVLYVLSNHQRFINLATADVAADLPKPEEFQGDVEVALQKAFRVTFPAGNNGRPDKDNGWYIENIPKLDTYAAKKSFNAVHIVPEKPIKQLEWKCQAYEYQAGKEILVMIVLIYPSKIREQPRESLAIAMETLDVSPARPAKPAKKGSVPVAPSGF